tara:strand:+ start:269 stop:586 length:318 start_codon:yes stop_codon:yes gene_type:complete
MSIFQKQQIKVGDLVIGVKKYGWNNNGAAMLERYFTEPSLVLEIKEDSALVFFEQEGPTWYNLTKLERCYVKDEFSATNNQQPDRRVVAEDRLDSDRTPGNKSDT